jgi:hypothetical protein
LKSNELIFGSCDAHLPFLPESEIPTDFREHIDKVSEADAKRNLKTPCVGELPSILKRSQNTAIKSGNLELFCLN